jgi:competence protein ComFC
MKFLNPILNILFPPLCLHCEERLEKKRALFCTVCLEQLAPIDQEGRCRICFAEEDPCQRCITRTVVIKRQAAACSNFGSARTLAAYLEKGNAEFLPAAASLMLLQFFHLQWPLPDLIIPLPGSLWERCKKGKSMNALLVQEMARLLQCPSEIVLRAAFDKRSFLEKAEIRTKPILIERKKKHLCDKRLLLLAVKLDDDLFRQAAEALLEGFASEIFALSFAI